MPSSPLPYTLLAPARYARIMGITPPHFFMATASNLSPQVWPISTCGGVWPRHTWQNFDQVSLEDVVLAIKQAEDDLARVVGYYPAPLWFSEESHDFPRDFYRESLFQIYDVRGMAKGINARWGRIVETGRRAVTLLGTATVGALTLEYTDDDSDGFYETATVTVAGITATTEVCKVKVYFTGKGGAMEWEIRPERSKNLSGGTFTATFDSWLFIDPELQSVYPTEDGFSAVDISTTDNFVTSVEVYYEYTDTTATSAQFVWEPTYTTGFCTCCDGSGCEACTMTTQDGCAHVRDYQTGILVPTPSTYTAGSGWTSTGYTAACRAPDQVRLWYRAGEQSEEFKAGRSCDPLSNQWALVIAWLATSYLIKPPCNCAGVRAKFEYLQEDLTRNAQGLSYFTGDDVLECPFGSTRGGMLAWKRVKHLMGRRLFGAVI